MTPQAIRMAAYAVRTYKTRDPFEIIERRNIKLRMFTTMPHLLGYFTIMTRRQYIGINAHADEREQITAAGHELGHSFLDYRTAASGIRFEDTMAYSVDNRRSEKNANLFDAELLIEDDQILVPIHYEDYKRVTQYIEEHIDKYGSARARFDFEQEQLMDFADTHSDMPSIEQLAYEIGVDKHLVEFKLEALRHKGCDLPNLPETKPDFLKRF